MSKAVLTTKGLKWILSTNTILIQSVTWCFSFIPNLLDNNIFLPCYRFISAGPDQRRTESSDSQGNVRGSYTFLDDKGVQRYPQLPTISHYQRPSKERNKGNIHKYPQENFNNKNSYVAKNIPTRFYNRVPAKRPLTALCCGVKHLQHWFSDRAHQSKSIARYSEEHAQSTLHLLIIDIDSEKRALSLNRTLFISPLGAINDKQARFPDDMWPAH